MDMSVFKAILCVLLTSHAKSSSERRIPALAIDCTTKNEIIQGEHKTILTRVTVVDEDKQIVYDVLVVPVFRTVKHGELNCVEFSEARQTINYIINCRLLVGHNLKNVLRLLDIEHPLYLQRDTLFFYSSCVNLPDVRSSLKELVKTLLGKDIQVDGYNTSENAIATMEIYNKYQKQWEKHVLGKHRTAFALDCEMIECMRGGQFRMEVVAKLSIVDHLGDVVYDKLFKPELPVSSYRTFVTGLRKANFTDAVYLSDERDRLESLLEGNIVVGHAIAKDLSLLGIHHPFLLIRDSSTYETFCRHFPNKKTPSLRELSSCLLNVTIQRGHHDSVEDAHATMMLYLKYRRDWDEEISKLAELFVSD